MNLDDTIQLNINNSPLILQLIEDRKRLRKELLVQQEKITMLQRTVDVLHNDVRKWMLDTQYMRREE